MDPVAGAIHHIALRVGDVERSVDFYHGVLGLPLLRRLASPEGEPRAVWLAAGSSVLMLERTVRGSGLPAGSGHVLALSVSDLAVWQEHLERRGVAVVDRTPFTFYLTDPDGHRVGLTIFREELLPQKPPEGYTDANPTGES